MGFPNVREGNCPLVHVPLSMASGRNLPSAFFSNEKADLSRLDLRPELPCVTPNAGCGARFSVRNMRTPRERPSRTKLPKGSRVRLRGPADSSFEAANLAMVCEFAELPADRIILWARQRFALAA